MNWNRISMLCFLLMSLLVLPVPGLAQDDGGDPESEDSSARRQALRQRLQDRSDRIEQEPVKNLRIRGGRGHRPKPIFGVGGIALQGEKIELFHMGFVKAPVPRRGKRDREAAGSDGEGAREPSPFRGGLNIAGNRYMLIDVELERDESALEASPGKGKGRGATNIKSIQATVVMAPDRHQARQDGGKGKKGKKGKRGKNKGPGFDPADLEPLGSLNARVVLKSGPGGKDEKVSLLDGTVTLDTGGAWRILGRIGKPGGKSTKDRRGREGRGDARRPGGSRTEPGARQEP